MQHGLWFILSKCEIITLDDFRNIHTVLVIAIRGGERKNNDSTGQGRFKVRVRESTAGLQRCSSGSKPPIVGDARIVRCVVLLPALQNAFATNGGCAAAPDKLPRMQRRGTWNSYAQRP